MVFFVGVIFVSIYIEPQIKLESILNHRKMLFNQSQNDSTIHVDLSVQNKDELYLNNITLLALIARFYSGSVIYT